MIPLILLAILASSPSALPNEALEELKARLATRAASVREDITASKDFLLGPIRDVDDMSLVIMTKRGGVVATMSANTVILQDKTELSKESLKEGQRVAVIGSGNPLAAEKIFLAESRPTTRVVLGTISAISEAADSYTLTPRKGGANVVFVLDPLATISLRGGAAAHLSSLQINTVALAAGNVGENETIVVTRMVILELPQGDLEEDGKPPATTSAAAQSLLSTARAKLARFRGAREDLFTLLSMTTQTWGDTSLGVPQAGNVYAPVMIPGYRIIFQSEVQQYVIHTDANGSRMILLEPYTIL